MTSSTSRTAPKGFSQPEMDRQRALHLLDGAPSNMPFAGDTMAPPPGLSFKHQNTSSAFRHLQGPPGASQAPMRTNSPLIDATARVSPPPGLAPVCQPMPSSSSAPRTVVADPRLPGGLALDTSQRQYGYTSAYRPASDGYRWENKSCVPSSTSMDASQLPRQTAPISQRMERADDHAAYGWNDSGMSGHAPKVMPAWEHPTYQRITHVGEVNGGVPGYPQATYKVDLDGKRAGWVDQEGNLLKVWKKTKRGKRGGRTAPKASTGGTASPVPGEPQEESTRAPSDARTPGPGSVSSRGPGSDSPLPPSGTKTPEPSTGMSTEEAKRLLEEKQNWEREKAMLMEQLLHMELMHQDLSERALDRDCKASEVASLRTQLARLQQEHAHLQEALLFTDPVKAADAPTPEAINFDSDASSDSGDSHYGSGLISSTTQSGGRLHVAICNELYDLQDSPSLGEAHA